MSGDFDIKRAYGPSAGDHRNRGPAYLLLARGPVHLMQALTGMDKAALWHLMNFITFLIGVFFLYRLSLRWIKPWAAFAAALLFSSQPLLWGHAFINPKDPPFMTVFLAAMYFGFRMVDNLSAGTAARSAQLRQVILPGILMGLATNLRVIGPLTGVLLFVYALFKRKPRILLWFVPAALIAALTTYLTWPYMWDAPIARFTEVLTLMSNNPTSLKVLFLGQTYRAYALPHRYLPLLMSITLTEPVWFLFVIGLGVAFVRFLKKRLEWQTLGPVLAWFAILVLYVLIKRPPMYDGFRHFLFILPPVFIVAGFAFDAGFTWIRANWLRILILTALILPGILAGVKLHPYEYTYYNTFVGGTNGAFRTFETDYWLTCYKEAVEQFNQQAPPNATLVVYREAANAAYYAADGINVQDFRAYAKNITSGDYVLVASRSNEDLHIERKAPIVISVGRDGATFCVIKQVE